MKLYFFIFLGGGLGSLTRFIVSAYLTGRINTLFPVGTLTVNMTGSFLAGILYELFDNFTVSSEMRTFMLIGFLGGYTTFSSFALENVNILRSGEHRDFLVNLAGQSLASLVMVISGIVLVRFTIKYFLR